MEPPPDEITALVPSQDEIVAFLEAAESVGKPLYITVDNVKCAYAKHTKSNSEGVYHVYFKKHAILCSGNKVHTEFNWAKILYPNFSGVGSSVLEHELVKKWGYTSSWATYVNVFLSAVDSENQHIELIQSSAITESSLYDPSDYATLTYKTASGEELTVSWGQRSVLLHTQFASTVGCSSFINIKNSQVVTAYK